MILFLNRSGQVVTVKLSTTSHHNAGLGRLTPRTNGKANVCEYYYASSVSADLTIERHKTKPFAECVMLVPIKTFCKWANDLPARVTDIDYIELEVGVVLEVG